jgi:putative transposase
MTDRCNRPLDRVYPVIFIDAIHVKIRDGQVANRPIYVVLGVTVAGERDILGLSVQGGAEAQCGKACDEKAMERKLGHGVLDS